MKTIEEVATKIANLLNFPRNKEGFGIMIRQAFVAGAAFAQQWIPVEEELPKRKDENYQIILRYSDEIITTYWVVKTLTKAYHKDFFKRHNVTHWRYIELNS